MASAQQEAERRRETSEEVIACEPFWSAGKPLAGQLCTGDSGKRFVKPVMSPV